mgnify:CR=1 FL=1
MKSSDDSVQTQEGVLWTLLQIGNHHFAIPSDSIIQAMAAPTCFPLPYAPDHVVGMAHFDGDVLPCIALDIAFGLSGGEGHYAECAVIRHDARRAIIMATTVLRHIPISDSSIQAISDKAVDPESAGSAIVGETTINGLSVFLLDPAYLVSFSARRESHAGRPGLVDIAEDEHREIDEDLSCYLYINVAGQHYAIDVSLAREIVTFDSVTRMPGAPSPIRGLCIVRDQSYLLLSSSDWLGIGAEAVTDTAVIVSTPAGDILLDIDSVEAVRMVPDSSVRPLSHEDACLRGVIEIENEALRGILNVAAIANHVPDLQRYIPKAETSRKQEELEDLLSFLLIRWDRELFAIDLHEIIRLEQSGETRRIEDSRFSSVFSFDGDTIPVIRDEIFYGMGSKVDHRDGYLILNAEGFAYAAPLQNAERIITTSRSSLLKRGNQRDERFSGTIRHDDKLVTLINMAYFRQQASSHGITL